MNHYNELNNNEESHNLQVWMCSDCQCVHLKTVNVMLNFSKTEFANFVRVVMEIYSQEFGGLELHRIFNLLKQEDDVLLSQTIA